MECGADADDEPAPGDLRDAAGAPGDGRGHDHRVAQHDGRTTPAADGAGRRGAPGRVPGGDQHAKAEGRVGATAPRGPLSKDAISRLVGRLRGDFETWRSRDLAEEDIRYLFLDGWFPKVRLGRRRERVPVLVTLGVRGDGQRVVLDLRLAGEESAASWGASSPA